MIKILVFAFGVLISNEYLVHIEMQLWQTSFLSNVMCFLSGVGFGHFLSLRKKIKQTVSDDIDDFFSRVSQKNEKQQDARGKIYSHIPERLF